MTAVTERDPTKAVRLLVVEDDPDMRSLVQGYFTDEGMDVVTADTRASAVERALSSPIDLVILDLRLGSENGLDVLKEIRAKGDVPVIIVTGHRRAEIDRIIGLELGADDYVLKPFSLRELLSRIRVVLRRSEGQPRPGPSQPDGGRYRFADWTLDRRRRTVTDAAGQNVPLTKGEYALLCAFVDAPGRPLSREHLLQATRVHEDIFDRSIDVQILRLRRRLEIDPSQPKIIVTQRGFGYVLAVPVERL